MCIISYSLSIMYTYIYVYIYIHIYTSSLGVGGKKVDEEQRIGQKRLNSMRGYWHQLCQVVSDGYVYKYTMRLFICIYTFPQKFIHIYMYMYIYLHIYLHTYLSIYINVYIYMYTYIHR
jgi:hypothetical protein